MAVRCLFGMHKPSQGSISRRDGVYVALCETCTQPLERNSRGRWKEAKPLTEETREPA